MVGTSWSSAAGVGLIILSLPAVLLLQSGDNLFEPVDRALIGLGIALGLLALQGVYLNGFLTLARQFGLTKLAMTSALLMCVALAQGVLYPIDVLGPASLHWLLLPARIALTLVEALGGIGFGVAVMQLAPFLGPRAIVAGLTNIALYLAYVSPWNSTLILEMLLLAAMCQGVLLLRKQVEVLKSRLPR
jgi:hypothetical protein